MFTHLSEGGNEAGDAHQASVGEQLGHLRNAPDILLPVRGGEAQVSVQSMADVVAVQGVAGDPVGDQVLL